MDLQSQSRAQWIKPNTCESYFHCSLCDSEVCLPCDQDAIQNLCNCDEEELQKICRTREELKKASLDLEPGIKRSVSSMILVGGRSFLMLR